MQVPSTFDAVALVLWDFEGTPQMPTLPPQKKAFLRYYSGSMVMVVNNYPFIRLYFLGWWW